MKEEPYENNVGFSERADVPIEPRLSEQWFLKYPRIEEAKAAVRDGHIKFWPDHWSKVYLNWLDKIQDWCISRQVWWGHRIPVWYKKGARPRKPIAQNREGASRWTGRPTRRIGSRRRTRSTPGRRRGCGRLRRWAGRSRMRNRRRN